MSKDNKASFFSDNEIQFIAEDELIEIIPNFELQTMRCIDGEYGPFRASLPCKVPMWLALQLKRFKKCQVKPPPWMEAEFLTQHLEQEQNSRTFHHGLPFHYIEISNMLLAQAVNDIPDSATIRRLLADIEDIRRGKTRESMKKLQDDQNMIEVTKWNGIGAMELNTMRPFCIEALNTFKALRGDEAEGLDATQSQRNALSQNFEAKSALPQTTQLRRYRE